VKRVVLLCVLSGIMGAVLAVGLSRAPDMEERTAAQEPAAWPSPGPRADLGLAATPRPAPAAAPAPDDLMPEERVNVAVYENVNRSVVNITTKGFQGERFLLIEIPSEGEGSGLVIDRQGNILTNFHVVDGARQIQVTLFDGNTYEARMVGQDPATDVAVVKIEAPSQSLYPVVFGSSANLKVGQRVFAIGNPFGLERTLSTGIISSLNRSLPSRRSGRSIKSIIQIDAAINPGNSGGPLMDSHARMIGMNTAIASKTGENTGVGFAVPINTIARVVPQLIQNGRVRRPGCGIENVWQTDRGLLIRKLVKGGPAERAGLQGPGIKKEQKRQGPLIVTYETTDLSAADMIVAVDGKPIKTADEFLDMIEAKQPGEQVVITAVRGGQARQVKLTLDVAG
jgi:S1-C subfamily serine protease